MSIDAKSGMTFDEANAKLTTELAGRTVDYVGRSGKELELVMTDGHVVVMQVADNGEIHYKRTDVRVYVRGLEGVLFPGALR